MSKQKTVLNANTSMKPKKAPTKVAVRKTPRKTHKKIKERPEVRTFHDEYFLDMYTFRNKPVHDHYLEQLALEWVTLAKEDDEMLTLEEFYNLKGVTKKVFGDWIARSDKLYEAREFVKQIIGVRREKGALTRKYDANMIKFTLAFYNVDMRIIEEWRASLAAKLSGTAGTVTVVEIPQFEDSDIQPQAKLSKHE